MRRCVVAALVACLTPNACATAGSWRDSLPERATLEVSNRTDDARQIVVRGASEGIVEAGTRRRFRWLAGGRTEVLALSTTQSEERTVLKLTPGDITRWEIGSERPAPPELGDIRIHNQLPRLVNVSTDKESLGVILPGDERVFRDLTVGPVVLSATVPETGLVLSKDLVVPTGEAPTWTITAPTSTARLVNDGVDSVIASLDGREVGRVLPGDTLELSDIASGDHVFSTVDTVSTVTRSHTFTLQPDAPYTWSLSADRGVVEVINGSGEALVLAPLAGRPQDVLAKGARLTVSDVEPGERTLTGVGETSKLPYEETLTVRPGQSVRWHVNPIATTVRVDNATRRPLEFYVDATWQTRLEAGDTRVVTNVAPGSHELVAVSPDGATVYRKHIEAPALRAATWRIVADPASYQVDNQRPEALFIFADGRGLGEVPSGQSLTFTGLEAGRRLFEAVGVTTGRTLKRSVELAEATPERAPDVWTVRAPSGTLVITNSSSESLFTEGALATTQDSLEPGATGTFQLPVGRAVIRLIGVTSGMTHTRDFEVGLDQLLTWDIGTSRGVVVVENKLQEPLTVTIDGAELGRVEPGAVLRSGDIASGPHELACLTGDSGMRLTVVRMVGPATEARWTIQPEPARLVISNDATEAVAIRIDDRPYGRVEAGTRSGFDGLAPGKRNVEAMGLVSGWRRSMTLTLRSGGSEVVPLATPTAVLVVDNQSGEPITVGVEDRPRGLVTPGTTVPLTVPAGQRKLTTLGTESGHVQVFDVALAVGQSHHLLVPRPRARLVVVNRTASKATVRLSDRVLGEIEAGGTGIYEDLSVAHWWLTAHDSDQKLTHSEHRRAEAGETRTWILTNDSTGTTDTQPPADQPPAEDRPEAAKPPN